MEEINNNISEEKSPILKSIEKSLRQIHKYNLHKYNQDKLHFKSLEELQTLWNELSLEKEKEKNKKVLNKEELK